MENQIIPALSEMQGESQQVKVSASYDDIQLTEAEVAEALRAARREKSYKLNMEKWRENMREETKPVKLGKEDFLNHIKKNFPEFDVQKQKEQFEFLLNYFTGENQSKGLLLHGGVGCGKTTLMQIFRNNPLFSFAVKSCREIASEYATEGIESIKKYYRNLNGFPNTFRQTEFGICFDDMGEEPSTKHFGTHINVIEDIILFRYNNPGLWSKTHVTTNLTGDQIEEMYGKRVRSRMREMFHVVRFENIPDLRK